MKQTTAILFFSRNAQEEASNKKLLGQNPYSANVQLCKYLIAKTQKEIKKSKIDSFNFFSEMQIGDSFGARICNAIEAVFSKGYENIIVLGNDCPELTAKHLNKADQILNSGKQVLGKDKRGGAWLLGISKSSFDTDTFHNLDWESENFANSFQENTLASNGLFCFPEILSDINSVSELFYFLQSQKDNSKLVIQIKQILNDCKVIFVEFVHRSVKTYFCFNFNFRGPPYQFS